MGASWTLAQRLAVACDFRQILTQVLHLWVTHANLQLANADNQIIPEFGTAILPRISARITNNPGIK